MSKCTGELITCPYTVGGSLRQGSPKAGNTVAGCCYYSRMLLL